ncbi:hypothetical protein BN1708_019864, partial [Verticillium longisporum]
PRGHEGVDAALRQVAGPLDHDKGRAAPAGAARRHGQPLRPRQHGRGPVGRQRCRARRRHRATVPRRRAHA